MQKNKMNKSFFLFLILCINVNMIYGKIEIGMPNYKIGIIENDPRFIFKMNTNNRTKCREVKDCDGNGLCINEFIEPNISKCKCDDDYTTYDCDINIECCYKRKNQLTAFLLQFFLGWVSGGTWYLGRIDWGISMVVLFFVGFCIACILGAKDEDAGKCIWSLFSIVIIVLWLVQLGLIGANNLSLIHI